MRHVAIIGSGPAGFYTAEALQKQFGDGIRIDLIDRLPVPYGLIRSGVAPDHQSIKAVYKRYEKVALAGGVRFLGHVGVGDQVAIDELLGLYDSLILATGAPNDRRLGVQGDDLPGVIGSAAFVGWYNGHPDFAELDPPLDGRSAVVIGNGNVALDVARILAKTRDEFVGSDIACHALDALTASSIEAIHLLGRRGPHQIAMTPKELGELGHLAEAAPEVEAADLPDEAEDAALEPGQRKSVSHLRAFAAAGERKRKRIVFDFFAMPVAIEGDSRVERVVVERTRLDADGRASGTGERYTIDCGLVVSCIGYQTPAIPGVPFDAKLGRFPNNRGLIAPGLYCVGWAPRGPSGTIGTNGPVGFEDAVQIREALGDGDSGKQGGAGLDALLAARGVHPVSFADWQRIEAAETGRARDGSPREKFTRIAEMIEALGR
jgi:ferredoxin--NADP+ reductase